MGLLDLIKDDESFDYISLKEVINFLTEKTNSTIQEVAIYLLNKEVPMELACHVKGSDFRIKETSGKAFSYGMFRAYGKNWATEYLTNIAESHSCDTWDQLNTYNLSWENWGIQLNNSNIELLEQTYWCRQYFLSIEPIKSLNLFGEMLLESNKNLAPIWDDNYLDVSKTDNPDLKEIDLDVYVGESIDFEDVSTYQKVKKYPLFFKNNTFTPQEVACLISNYHPNQVGSNWNSVAWLNSNPEFEEALDFTFSAVRGRLFEEVDVDIFVISSDELKFFLNSKDIFIDGFNRNLNQEVVNIGNSTVGNASLEYYQQKIKELLEKIEELKNDIQKEGAEIILLEVDLEFATKENAQLKDTIKLLESEQLNNKADNLLDQIFDESVTDRYAPDLALSIKLWQSIYIDNPKNDSHTNKANNWIMSNTRYDQSKPSATKLREITTPFINWSTHRDKNFKK